MGEPMAATTGQPPAEAEQPSAPQPALIDADPLYWQALTLLQQGQWQKGEEALATLDRCYSGAPELAKAREVLTLRLSAEESWLGLPGRPGKHSLKTPLIRALAIGNALLYVVVILMWMLCR